MSAPPSRLTGPGRQLLLDAFHCAVAAASARNCLTADRLLQGDALVLGTGKASAAMAVVVNEQLTGAVRGLVVTRYGHG